MEIADGRYTLEEELGAGGAATVFRATDNTLGVKRAIKVLRAGKVHPELRDRMLAEARAMARLDHPNILRVYDVSTDGEVDYVVMDLAEGGTLADQFIDNGPMAPVRALQYGIQVLSALAAAHSAGIVHRDVKPQNILLDGDGTALLADFGIALIADERGTRTGAAMGSLQFMAPEQRMDARTVGPAADIYATGSSLYALLTGRNPVDLFTAGPDSERFEGLDPGIVALLRTATAYELTERYPNARAMGADVLRLLEDAGHEPLKRPDPSVPAAFPMPSKQLDSDLPARKRTTMVPQPPPPALDAAIGFLTDGVGTLDPTMNAPPEPQPPARDDWVRWVAGAVALAMVALLLCFGVRGLPGLVGAPGTASTPEAPAPSPAPGTAPDRPDPPAPADIAEPAPSSEPAPDGPSAPAPTKGKGPPDHAAAPTVRPVPNGPGPIGTWTGSLNGRPATLVLTGTLDALAGSFDVRSGGKVVPSEVSGRYLAETRTLVLVDDHDADDAGEYEAVLDPSGKRLEGTFRYRTVDRRVPFAFRR